MTFVRVIARGTLYSFLRNRVDRSAQRTLKLHLDSWYASVTQAHWKNPAELKLQFGSASIISAERVLFNIKGNDYRLVSAIDYSYQIVLIKWIGTHREYDRIDVKEIAYDQARYATATIKTAEDHQNAIRRIEQLIGCEFGSSEGDELDILATLVDAYEAKMYPMDAPDPIAAIQFQMEQQNLSRKDLEPMIGSRARVSEVLGGKRPLTLAMVRRVRSGLGISADILIGSARKTRRAGVR